MPTLCGFLGTHKVAKGKPYTHTTLSRPMGSYFIPPADQAEFEQLYIAAIRAGGSYSITEKQGPNSPLVVDCDFRYPLKTPRRHTRDHVLRIVKAYWDVLRPLVDIGDATCYVMEREDKYETAKETKDGIHLMFPSLCGGLRLKHVARERVMKELAAMFKELGCTNPASDIVDAAVINATRGKPKVGNDWFGNNWFMFGSTKLNCTPYRLTAVFNSELEDVTEATDTSLETLIRVLSVRGPDEPTYYFVETTPTPEPEIAPVTPDPSEGGDPGDSNDRILSEAEFAKITKLVSLLSDDRCDSEALWIDLGHCLKNMGDERLFALWDGWSRHSAKYLPGECERRWAGFRQMPPGEGFGIGSLVHWAKEDSPDEYKAQFATSTATELQQYEATKLWFEKTHFKIMQPIMYARIGADNKFNLLKENELQQTYRNLYYLIEINGEMVKKEFVKSWIADMNIRTYESIDFLPPPMVCPANVYNTWTPMLGELLAAKYSDEELAAVDISPISHHLAMLSGFDAAVLNYTLIWFAQIIQTPGMLSRVAIVWRTEVEGAGKGLALNWFGNRILGKDKYVTTHRSDDLVGRFANAVANKLLVNLDEAKGKETFDSSDAIKNLITEPTIGYEEKCKPIVQMSNFARFLFTSNNSSPVKIGLTDRRFLCVNCGEKYVGDGEYLKKILAWMKDDRNAAAFWWYLKNKIEIPDDPCFFINGRPKTELHEEMRSLNIPFIARWLQEEMPSLAINDWIRAGELYSQYRLWRERNGFAGAAEPSTRFGLALKKMGGNKEDVLVGRKGMTVRLTRFVEYWFDEEPLMKQLKSLGYTTTA